MSQTKNRSFTVSLWSNDRTKKELFIPTALQDIPERSTWTMRLFSSSAPEALQLRTHYNTRTCNGASLTPSGVPFGSFGRVPVLRKVQLVTGADYNPLHKAYQPGITANHTPRKVVQSTGVNFWGDILPVQPISCNFVHRIFGCCFHDSQSTKRHVDDVWKKFSGAFTIHSTNTTSQKDPWALVARGWCREQLSHTTQCCVKGCTGFYEMGWSPRDLPDKFLTTHNSFFSFF